MKVSVMRLNGEDIVLEVDPDMTVDKLKQRLQELQTSQDQDRASAMCAMHTLRRAAKVELVVGEKLAKDHLTLTEAGISSTVQVQLLFTFNTVECCSQRGSGLTFAVLTAVSIPDSATSIKHRAFGGCKSLFSLKIPDSVMSIGKHAFADCSLISLTIPNSVTCIGHGAFSGCRLLTSLTIPNSVTSIESRAFQDCSSLTSVTLPDSVIRDSVFAGCSSLISLTIPNSVACIGCCAFAGCTSLTSLTIPESVTYIEFEAFSGCHSLSSLKIPASVTSIGERAFSDCCSLRSLLIYGPVTFIGEHAFQGCSSLLTLTVQNSGCSAGTTNLAGRASVTGVIRRAIWARFTCDMQVRGKLRRCRSDAED